jgi:hypothetical protein
VSVALVRFCVLAIAGCNAAQAISLPDPDPGHANLGASFVEQQRARTAAASFVVAAPSPAWEHPVAPRPGDAHYAFVRYRVGVGGAGGAPGPASAIETHAVAGVRFERALLVHEVGNTTEGSRTSLAVDWPEASARVSVGDVSAGRPAGGGEPLRLAGLAVRRAGVLPRDDASWSRTTGPTTLAGEMTVSPDGEGGYVAAFRDDALAPALPGVLPGWSAAAALPTPSAPAPSNARAVITNGLDRPLPPMPRPGSTDFEYAMGAARSGAGAATSTSLRDAFIASMNVGVTRDLSVGAQAEGRDGRRDGGVGVAIALGDAGALRGSIGGSRNAHGDACATAGIDYRVSRGSMELAAAYARAPADVVPVQVEAASTAVQSLGGRLRITLNATDSVALATDRASSTDAASYTSTRVTFRRALAPAVAVDGGVAYVSGTGAATAAVPEGWLASLNVRWSLDVARSGY